MSMMCGFGPMASPQRMVWPEPPAADRFRVGDVWRSSSGIRWSVERVLRDWKGARVSLVNLSNGKRQYRRACDLGPRGERQWSRESWGGSE